jgi:Flp pilus assembly secretin CpaC
MKHSIWVPSAVLLFVPIVAFAQSEAKSPAQTKQTIVLNISMVEADGSAAVELERSGRDKKQVDSLIANGRASLIAEVELEAASSRTITTHIGQRVPIQTASVPVAVRPEGRNPSDRDQRDQTATAAFGFGVPQIQYQNTGISVTATPNLMASGKISVALSFALSDFNASLSTLTPVFINRDINSTIVIGDGETIPILSALERGRLAPSDRQPDRTTPQGAVRFMILLTVRLVD